MNPDLAGGALLDLGIYALTWVFQSLYTVQKKPQAPSVISSMRKYKLGCDQLTSMVLTFPREQEGDAHGIATTSLRVSSDPSGKNISGPIVRIQGTKGEIQIFPPTFNPSKSKLILKDGSIEEKDWTHPGPGPGSGFRNGFGKELKPEGEGMGMFWRQTSVDMRFEKEGRKGSSRA